MPVFTHRIATEADIPAIETLMDLAITGNMKAFLSPAEIEASRASMGVDRTLVSDGTYFLIEIDQDGTALLVGCGGWGKRATLYGGDATSGRDDRLLDPATEVARIRAMYTHPDWIRQGIGSLLLTLGETAARDAGFRMIELGATVPGEPLYRARGYVEISRRAHPGANGTASTIISMRKPL